jgi:hypothetical protein
MRIGERASRGEGGLAGGDGQSAGADVLAAEIVDYIEATLEQFRTIAEDSIREQVRRDDNDRSGTV